MIGRQAQVAFVERLSLAPLLGAVPSPPTRCWAPNPAGGRWLAGRGAYLGRGRYLGVRVSSRLVRTCAAQIRMQFAFRIMNV